MPRKTVILRSLRVIGLLPGVAFPTICTAAHFETKFNIKHPISEQLTVSGQLRVATDFSVVGYHHMDVGLQIRPFQDWQFAAHYRSIHRRPDSYRRREERIYLQVERTVNGVGSRYFSAVKIKIRTRVESRSRDHKEHSYRTRLRFKLKSTRRLSGQLQPFASQEFYYDCSQHTYNNNRINIGVDVDKKGGVRKGIYLKLSSRRKYHRWATDTSLVYKITF